MVAQDGRRPCSCIRWPGGLRAPRQAGRCRLQGQACGDRLDPEAARGRHFDLTGKIEQALADIQSTLPEGVSATNLQFRQATFIETSVDNVKTVLVEAAFVVALILFLFLMNWRATFISLTAIPISILVTVLVFNAFGLTINTMTLGGLAIAIGELVDDAVVDVETSSAG